MYENTLVEEFTDEELIGFRHCLAEEYRELDENTLEMMLEETLANMSPKEAENFLKTLKKIGKKALPVVSQVGQVALPAAGAAIGAFGGPVGTLVGTTVGKVGANALARASKKASSKRASTLRQKPRQRHAVNYPKRVTSVHRSSANQLLQLIQSPQFLQALASLSIGVQGRRAVKVRSRESLSSVPIGAFLNLLESLASQAAMEAAQNESMIPSYLEAADGEALCDLANPDERARVLMERLQEDETFYLENWQEDKDDESDEAVLDWLEHAGLLAEPV